MNASAAAPPPGCAEALRKGCEERMLMYGRGAISRETATWRAVFRERPSTMEGYAIVVAGWTFAAADFVQRRAQLREHAVHVCRRRVSGRVSLLAGPLRRGRAAGRRRCRRCRDRGGRGGGGCTAGGRGAADRRRGAGCR